MPRVQTKYFGELDYSPDAIYHFPHGVPGFEDQTDFAFLEQPGAHPLVFMQSLSDPNLCFVTVSVLVADAQFRAEWPAEDCEALALPPSECLELGRDVYCMAIVTIQEGEDPTCNLGSPIVLNPVNRRGVQSLLDSSEGALRFPLLKTKEVTAC